MIPSMHHETKVREKATEKKCDFRKKKTASIYSTHPFHKFLPPQGLYHTHTPPTAPTQLHISTTFPQKPCLIQLGFPYQASVIVVNAQLFGLNFLDRKRKGTSRDFHGFLGGWEIFDPTRKTQKKIQST